MTNKINSECIFVIGGIKSGKSQFALDRLKRSNKKKYFLATCPIIDDEMNEKILNHQNERKNFDIETIESPLSIKKHFINLQNLKSSIVLIDCLGLWVNNIMHEYQEISFNQFKQVAIEEFSLIFEKKLNVILVSNEVGNSLVAADIVSRRYQDNLGWLNQYIAKCSKQFYQIICGQSLKIK